METFVKALPRIYYLLLFFIAGCVFVMAFSPFMVFLGEKEIQTQIKEDGYRGLFSILFDGWVWVFREVPFAMFLLVSFAIGKVGESLSIPLVIHGVFGVLGKGHLPLVDIGPKYGSKKGAAFQIWLRENENCKSYLDWETLLTAFDAGIYYIFMGFETLYGIFFFNLLFHLGLPLAFSGELFWFMLGILILCGGFLLVFLMHRTTKTRTEILLATINYLAERFEEEFEAQKSSKDKMARESHLSK